MNTFPGTKHPFPNELAHPNVKADKLKWGIHVAKAIWSAANSTNAPNAFFKKRIAYENSLKVAFGQQDTSKWKPYLGINPKDKAGQWITAIDWRSKNYATKLLRMVIEKLRSVNYDAYVEMTDPTSINLKENARAKLNVIMEHHEFLTFMSQYTNRDFIGMSPEDIPLNDEDVDVNMEMSYKDRLAVELEDGINYRLKRNNWEQLYELLKFDIATFNASCLYINTDDFNRTTVERIYPGNGITPESDTPYFQDIRYGAHISYPTVAELKSMAGDELNNDDIKSIFDQVSNQKSFFETERSEVLDYKDTERVRVLNFRYATTNEVVYLEYTDETGRQRFIEKDYDYYKTFKQQEKFKNKFEDGRKLHRKPVTVIYEGKWVIDTSYIFKYGLKANTYYQKIKGKVGEPLLGYIFVNADYFEGRSVSLMEHIEPTIDELEILDKRIQKELSTPFPGGVQIDVNALAKMKFTFQGKIPEMGDIIEMAINQKIFLVDSSQLSNYNQPGSTQQAVVALQASGHTLVELMNMMQFRLMELKDLIGFNPTSAASQVNPDQLKAVSQMQIVETNTALGSFFRAGKFVFNELSKILAGIHFIEMKNDTQGQYDDVFGTDSVDFIRNADDVDFGIYVEARPTEEDWKRFEMELSQEVGKGTITEGDKIAILRFKNLKKAQTYMRSIERKRQRMEQQAQERQIMMNAQVQQQSNQQANQNRMTELQAEGALADKEGMMDMRKEQLRGMNKDRQTRTQADLNLRNTQALQSQKQMGDNAKTRMVETNKANIARLKDQQKPKPKR